MDGGLRWPREDREHILPSSHAFLRYLYFHRCHGSQASVLLLFMSLSGTWMAGSVLEFVYENEDGLCKDMGML